jgi:hypothetical protein
MTDLVTRIDSMSDGTQVMSDDELRVSTLELFFDLVFVFTITQLTTVLVHHPTGEALAQVVLMLAAWMYGAFAWLTAPCARPRALPPAPRRNAGLFRDLLTSRRPSPRTGSSSPAPTWS